MASIELHVRVIRTTFRDAMASHPDLAERHVRQARALLRELRAAAGTPEELETIDALHREVDASIT